MPVDTFTTFVRDVSRIGNCRSLRLINPMNVRNAALILKRKIFFWPNNAAGRDGCWGRRFHALGKTTDVIETVPLSYRVLKRGVV